MRAIFFVASLIAAQAGNAEPSEGEKLFMLHCSACHGTDGSGGGSMSSVLKIAPADLTGLAQRYGGEFPTEQVVSQIDGRGEYAGHGGTMPVYGWFFEGPEATISLPDGRQIKTTVAIQNIVLWLEAQQNTR